MQIGIPKFDNIVDFEDVKNGMLEAQMMTLVLQKHIKKLNEALTAANQQIAELEARLEAGDRDLARVDGHLEESVGASSN